MDKNCYTSKTFKKGGKIWWMGRKTVTFQISWEQSIHISQSRSGILILFFIFHIESDLGLPLEKPLTELFLNEHRKMTVLFICPLSHRCSECPQATSQGREPHVSPWWAELWVGAKSMFPFTTPMPALGGKAVLVSRGTEALPPLTRAGHHHCHGLVWNGCQFCGIGKPADAGWGAGPHKNWLCGAQAGAGAVVHTSSYLPEWNCDLGT